MGIINNILILTSKEFNIKEVENRIMKVNSPDFYFEFHEYEIDTKERYYLNLFNIQFKEKSKYSYISSLGWVQPDVSFYSPLLDGNSNLVQISCYGSLNSHRMDFEDDIYGFMKEYIPDVELIVLYLDGAEIPKFSDFRKIYEQQGVGSKWFSSNGSVEFHRDNRE